MFRRLRCVQIFLLKSDSTILVAKRFEKGKAAAAVRIEVARRREGRVRRKNILERGGQGGGGG